MSIRKSSKMTGRTERSKQFLKELGLKQFTKKAENSDEEEKEKGVHKLTKNDLKNLMSFDEEEIKYIVERISNKRRIHLMKLLEGLPDLEDDFEFILSRKVSMNTEFDGSSSNLSPALFASKLEDAIPKNLNRKTMSRILAKPTWIEGNLEIHKKF